jgi:hypothetical protein
VDSLVTYGSEKVAYVAFARELTAAQRHAPQLKRQAASHKLPAKTGDSPSERSTRGTVPVFAAPDYSSRTKLIVAKWFARGLSGHLMWLIGEAILRGS